MAEKEQGLKHMRIEDGVQQVRMVCTFLSLNSPIILYIQFLRAWLF